jgi:hypothetical protein
MSEISGYFGDNTKLGKLLMVGGLSIGLVYDSGYKE